MTPSDHRAASRRQFLRSTTQAGATLAALGPAGDDPARDR